MRHLAHAEWEFLTTGATAALAHRQAQVHHAAANLALAEAGQYQVSGCLLTGAASAAEGAAAEPRLRRRRVAALHSCTAKRLILYDIHKLIYVLYMFACPIFA
jgi:L-ascorbate metabolism protein UlaG (beta-lactamase superfamily)